MRKFVEIQKGSVSTLIADGDPLDSTSAPTLIAKETGAAESHMFSNSCHCSLPNVINVKQYGCIIRHNSELRPFV